MSWHCRVVTNPSDSRALNVQDTSPDPSDSLPEVPASPLLGGFAGSVGDDDGGAMDL